MSGPVEATLPDGRRLLLYGALGEPIAAPAMTPVALTIERRFDELRGEDVAYATHRQTRTHLPSEADCPLCPGRPGAPATEVPYSAFEIAVFDNRFPAFAAPEGACEVVVYTDRHDGDFATLEPERAATLMAVWRDRTAELGGRPDVAYVMPFENRGVDVGVTLHHPHGQIYAFPFLPPVAAAERAADERLGGCAICALAARQRADGVRVVHETASTLAHVPYAARWPYEVHVTMKAHRPSLIECEAHELRELAAALQAVTRGYDALFDRPLPYMLCLHQAPTDERRAGHVHVELYSPARADGKVKYLAGCEQGAGTMLVDVLPEATAADLRAAIARATG